jgi:hypothetical protein
MLAVIAATGLWMWVWWLVALVFWIVFIYLTFLLAASKGRSPILWVILAVFFPLITIIILLIIPAKSRSAV